MMRIGMVLGLGANHRGFPPDIRVEKESKSLSSAGHKVFIFTRKLPVTAPENEYSKKLGARIIRAEIIKRNMLMKIKDEYKMFKPAWIPALEQFIIDYQPDILHVHDLPMVPTALFVAKKYKLPVVADLHENIPAAMLAHRSNYPFLKKMACALIWNYNHMRKQEAEALHKCARVIVVVPESIGRLEEYKISREKIFLVSNTEDETTFLFQPDTTDPQIINKYNKLWVASYIGGIGPHRGLNTVLESIPHFGDTISNFKLLIVGANAKDKLLLEKKSKKIGIQQFVEVIGWQSFSKVNSYVMASNVCLVPHSNFEHTQTTVPHKLFQYMICRKPVLVSDCRPLARIVNDACAGRVFTSDDPRSFANEIIWMYKNPQKCIEYGNNGHNAALGKYSWKKDSRRLVGLYNHL